MGFINFASPALGRKQSCSQPELIRKKFQVKTVVMNLHVIHGVQYSFCSCNQVKPFLLEG